MQSFKFKDGIIRTYSKDQLMHIPLFKGMIENFKDDGSIIQIDSLNGDIVNDLIRHKFIKINEYEFDELFCVIDFLMLNEKHVRTQIMGHLKYLLVNNINKINLNNLHKYIRGDDYKDLLSSIVNMKPKLIQLYPFVTHLNYFGYSFNKIDLTKFDNLVSLQIKESDIRTLDSFSNLKNLKKLYCVECYRLEDGCFDMFINLEILICSYCSKLKRPFNKNLESLKELLCEQCVELEDGCFNNFRNLEKLTILNSSNLCKPFSDNLKNLKILECRNCENLQNGCFDVFETLEELDCNNCIKLNKPFNNNLKNLKKLKCAGCINLENGCFDTFEKLEDLMCIRCSNLINPFNFNLKNLKKLNCVGCINLEDGCFDIFENLEELNCIYCDKLKGPFNKNLKNLRRLSCDLCDMSNIPNIFKNLERFNSQSNILFIQ